MFLVFNFEHVIAGWVYFYTGVLSMNQLLVRCYNNERISTGQEIETVFNRCCNNSNGCNVKKGTTNQAV